MHIAAVIGGLVALCGVTSATLGPTPRAVTTYNDPTELLMYAHPPVQQLHPIDAGSFLHGATRRPDSRPTSFPVLPHVPGVTAPATTLTAVRVPVHSLPPPVHTRTRAAAAAVPAPSLPGMAGTPYAVDLGPGCRFPTAPPRLPAPCRDRLRPIRRPTTMAATVAAPTNTTPAPLRRADRGPEATAAPSPSAPKPWSGRRHDAIPNEIVRILRALREEQAEKEEEARRRREEEEEEARREQMERENSNTSRG